MGLWICSPSLQQKSLRFPFRKSPRLFRRQGLNFYFAAIMLQFLNKPYPAHYPSQQNILLALVVGLFVGLFLLIFQPFNLDNLKSPYKPFLILNYGVISFIVVLFFNNFLPKYIPFLSDDKKWTVGREILFENTLILSIAICNTLYTPFLSPQNSLNLESFLHMTMNTVLVGVVPIAFFVITDYYRLLKRHVAESQSLQLKESLPEKEVGIKPLSIDSENEAITIFPDRLLYVESVGNYVNIVNREEEKLEKNLHRGTLKNLEGNIPLQHIIRCHRSYLVNLEQVQSVTGNAQGFKLQLSDCEEIIPVSRKYVPIVKAYFA